VAIVHPNPRKVHHWMLVDGLGNVTAIDIPQKPAYVFEVKFENSNHLEEREASLQVSIDT
jgi:hypothetical protein